MQNNNNVKSLTFPTENFDERFAAYESVIKRLRKERSNCQDVVENLARENANLMIRCEQREQDLEQAHYHIAELRAEIEALKKKIGSVQDMLVD